MVIRRVGSWAFASALLGLPGLAGFAWAHERAIRRIRWGLWGCARLLFCCEPLVFLSPFDHLRPLSWANILLCLVCL
ncbi:hypothetical protein F4821DRAFT_216074 [Hypoxylon rubiginosum]|uniref:Uncharacterized protein n=1 Tax=Hypoxylon rubiginosum TaxID=110542 RepID=A0ACC0CPN6_9PEZI|nr:hypothetical protein F4821DRAFT_216074 [Hypoxylon rubiginosum]